MKRGRDLGGADRYKHPQKWIDHIVATDPALSNVRLLFRPRYSGRLRVYGTARLEELGLPGYTRIGRSSLVSRRELVDTILHEETHHQPWQRAQSRSPRAWIKIADEFAEELYVRHVAFRFLRLQDYLGSRGRK